MLLFRRPSEVWSFFDPPVSSRALLNASSPVDAARDASPLRISSSVATIRLSENSSAFFVASEVSSLNAAKATVATVTAAPIARMYGLLIPTVLETRPIAFSPATTLDIAEATTMAVPATCMNSSGICWISQNTGSAR